MASAARTSAAQDVQATLGYAGGIQGRPRLDIVEPEKNNFTLEPQEMVIRDGRAFPGVHTLARNGFEFVRHRSNAAAKPETFEAANIPQVMPAGPLREYSAEMMEFLKDYLGASFIVPQVGSFLARTSNRAKTPTWARTANMVHLDYTQQGAEMFLKWNNDALGGEVPPYRHYAFLQTWRAVSQGPQDNTLAICDGASVPFQDGIEIDTVMGPANVPGKCFPFRLCKYREGHQWYYLPDMEPDDLLLFKGFDSRKPRAMDAMHSAFDNPLAGDDAVPRRSIEARFIAFFE